MKKISLSFLAFFTLLAINSNVQASGTSCTPDPNLTIPGFAPDDDFLPCIDVGVYYDQVIQFKLPATVDPGLGFPLTLNWVEIKELNNIPCGLSWEIDNPTAVYNGGDNGCARIFGTSYDPPGQYKLQLIVDVNIDLIGTLTDMDAAVALGSSYYFRIAQANGSCAPVDTLDDGLVASTSCPPPTCGAPASVWVSNVGSTNATLNWAMSPGVDHYVIEGNQSNLPIDGVSLTINNASATSFTTSILNSGTSYHWHIKACCDPAGNNCSGWSSTNVFSTSCPKPNPTSTTGITTNSCVLNWSPAGGANGYEIRGRACGAGSWVELTKNGGNTNSHNVNGLLAPCPCYEWQVRAKCRGVDSRNSGWTNLESFTSLCSKNGDEIVTATTGIDFNVDLYPNPASDYINIKLDGTIGVQDALVKITDINGKIVFDSFLTGNEMKFNTEHLANGVYQFVLKIDGSQKVERFVIAK